MPLGMLLLCVAILCKSSLSPRLCVHMQIGFLADRTKRRNLFFVVAILGAAPCLATYWVTEFWELLLLRTLTGISVGASFPLIFSLLGDLVRRGRLDLDASAGPWWSSRTFRSASGMWASHPGVQHTGLP